MKTLIVGLLSTLILGCSSLQDAGHSKYSFRPFAGADGKMLCCEAVIESGREVSNLSIHVVKRGEDYDVTVSVEGVKAFAGQAIAGEAANNAIPVVGGLLR